MPNFPPADYKLLKEFGFKPHELEVGKDQVMDVNWPKPIKCYRLIHESWKHSMEGTYFWLVNYLRHDLGYGVIHKITDLFSASEQSSFFGLGQQRIGMQQDKVSNFLAIIGKMTKELFQLVREMRILDERLSFYVDSMKRPKNIFAVKDSKKESKAWESAEITLKGYWVDLVEQGSKNPASVYGMAREVQFTTLPDLFFSIHPYDDSVVDEVVERDEFRKAFNRKVREVLKRKLRTYLAWKLKTKKELIDRRAFTLRYMFQHMHIIKLYMSYVKPYLRNILKLQFNERMSDSPDLVAAFEGSMVEVEIMGQALPQGNKEIHDCINIHFMFRTKPSLNYHAEGYNRGPIHEGEATLTYRTYAWTQEQIDKYIKMRDKEDFEMIKVLDKNLEFAMAELGDDIFRYLDEAEETMMQKFKGEGYVPYHESIGIKKSNAEKKDEKKKKKGGTDPFSALIGGFADLGSAFGGGKKKKDKPKPKLTPYQLNKEIDKAKGVASAKCWIAYKNYKKANKMITW